MSWPVAELDAVRRLRVLAAAVPEGRGTRFAFLGALRGPGTRAAAPLLRRVGRPVGRGLLERLHERVRGPR